MTSLGAHPGIGWQINTKLQSGFDRLPRLTIRIFNRSYSSWRVLLLVGMISGALLGLVLAQARHKAAGWGLCVAVANLLVYHSLNWLNERIAHRRRIVLLEHFLATMIISITILNISPLPLLACLDIWIISMAFGMSIGRTGCLLSGCCFGRPARIGVRYTWCVHAGSAAAIKEVRLAPVQLYESLVLLLLSAAGLAIWLARAQDGTAFSVILAGYASLRFSIEFKRGDYREFWLGLSEAQWTCLAIVISLGCVSYLAPGMPDIGAALAILVLIALICIRIIARNSIGRPPFIPYSRYQVDQLLRTVHGLRSALYSQSKTDRNDNRSAGNLPLAARIWDLPNQESRETVRLYPELFTTLSSGLQINIALINLQGHLAESFTLRCKTGKLDRSTAELVADIIQELVAPDSMRILNRMRNGDYTFLLTDPLPISKSIIFTSHPLSQ